MPFQLNADYNGVKNISKQEVDYLVDVWAKEYDVSTSDMRAVIQCESGYIHDVYGDHNKAYGLLQFHKNTFLWMSSLEKEKLNYTNPEHQIKLFAWALSTGLGKHWTCYKF